MKPLTYQIAQNTIPNPTTGKLYFYRSKSPNAGYVNNSTVEWFMTGVSLDIPAGVTVEIRPIAELENRGLYLRSQTLHGPLKVNDLLVSIHNLGNATVKIEPLEPIASIEAYATRQRTPWVDANAKKEAAA